MAWAGKNYIFILSTCDMKRVWCVGCRVTDVYHWAMYDYSPSPFLITFRPFVGFSLQTGYEHCVIVYHPAFVSLKSFKSLCVIDSPLQLGSGGEERATNFCRIWNTCTLVTSVPKSDVLFDSITEETRWLNPLNPTGHVMHQQLNIQQLYVLPTLYLCVFYLSESKQRLVPLTA